MAHPTVFDVAAFILKQAGTVSHMKLQKLVYYSQAWSLVWDEKPLFKEPIEAWVNGPVVRKLFAHLQGKFSVSGADVSPLGNASALSPAQKDTIKRVVEFYGKKTPQWLSDLTHMEAPWQEARVGIPPGARCDNEITHASMAEYYGSL